MPSILDELQPPDQPVAFPDLADPRVKALLADVPGNILKGHGRVFSAMQFVRFTDPAAARRWAKDIGAKITTAEAQQAQTERWRAANAPAATQEEKQAAAGDFFVGLYFTASGWAMLGLPLAEKAPEAFRHGLLSSSREVFGGRAAGLGDKEDDWEARYRQDLHALLLVAFDAPARVPAETFLAGALARPEIAHDAGGDLPTPGETGGRLYDNGGVKGRREVEHFGFRDGISQLRFLPSAERHRNPPRDELYPLRQALVPMRTVTGRVADDRTCGSFLVWRKLEQDVAEFEAGIAGRAPGGPKPAWPGLAAHLGDVTLRGLERARGWIVGRFRDGTPLALHDDPVGLPTNRFDYAYPGDAGPTGGKFCPFHAHIRKMNPRGDHQAQTDPTPRERLPVRRSVPYGRRALRSEAGRELIVDRLPEAGEKVGLLFMAFVGDIERQFEFLQTDWANRGDFPWRKAYPDPLIGRTGRDAVSVPRGDARAVAFPHCVFPRGGAYLFAPPASVFAAL